MRKKSDYILRACLLIGDAVMLILSFAMAYFIRVKVDPRPFTFESQFFEFVNTVVLLVPICWSFWRPWGCIGKVSF